MCCCTILKNATAYISPQKLLNKCAMRAVITLFFKPNAQRKTELNWTKLDRSVQFSSVQFSAVYWIGDELQCGMWLWNRDSEFTKWQHTAMWQVVLGWHATEFAQTSAILEFYIWFRFRPITAIDISFCTSLRNLIQIGPPSAEKMTSCRFSRWRISAIINFWDPNMGSLKSPVKLT